MSKNNHNKQNSEAFIIDGHEIGKLLIRGEQITSKHAKSSMATFANNSSAKIRADANLANLVYTVNSSEGRQELTSHLGDSEIYLITAQLENTAIEKTNEYQCLVLINNSAKEVTFVTAGTRIDKAITRRADLRDDIRLSLGLLPLKAKAAQELNNLILEQLGDEAKDYHFHYTGHSLGGALSDIAATDMGMKLHQQNILTKNKVSTVTFDNPGSYTLVKNQLTSRYLEKKQKEIKRHKDRMKEISKMKGSILLGATPEQRRAKETAKFDESARHKATLQQISETKLTLNHEWRNKISYKAFNNRPNLINTTDKQVGETFIIIPEGQKQRSSFFTFIGWVAHKSPVRIINKILQIISYGSLTEQIKEHGIENFVNVITKENGQLLYKNEKGGNPISLVDAAYNIKPVQYEKKLFESLKEIILKRKEGSTSHKEPDHSMTFEAEDKSSSSRIEFTHTELNKAKSHLKNQKIEHHAKDIKSYLRQHINTTSSSESLHKGTNSNSKKNLARNLK